MPTKNQIIYHDVEQGSPEWNELRTNQFTGSNAYKLLSSFGAGSWAQSKNIAWDGNFHTKRGHLLEQEAVELYQRIKNVEVSHTGFVTNSKYPNCLYSPDGYLEDRTIEVKCFAVKAHMSALKSLKLEILAQVHFGQLILDKPLTDVILYNPSAEIPVKDKLKIITIKRDRDIQNNFKKIIKAYNGKRTN